MYLFYPLLLPYYINPNPGKELCQMLRPDPFITLSEQITPVLDLIGDLPGGLD